MVLPDLGFSLGWLLIITGALFLLIEVHTPGFFATVPGTVMIILGILILLGIDIFELGMGDRGRCCNCTRRCRLHRVDVWADNPE